MKKFFFTLALIFIFVSSVSAATSEDVYVRQDVFDAKMELLFTRLHTEIQSLGNEIKGEMRLLEQRLDAKITAVDQRLTAVETNLNEKITSLNEKITGVETNLNEKITSLNEKITGVETNLNEKITAVETNLNEKIDAVDKNLNEKITDVEKKLEYSINTWATVLGWGIGWLTLLITLVAAAPVIREWVKLERKPSITLDDVRRLIEENNAKLNLNASK
ncbi:MAG: hypothetical protein IJS40_03635 [Synergistaceae bacterium]|nr:hypothetical protein [Synergistaceae bacterium]